MAHNFVYLRASLVLVYVKIPIKMPHKDFKLKEKVFEIYEHGFIEEFLLGKQSHGRKSNASI